MYFPSCCRPISTLPALRESCQVDWKGLAGRAGIYLLSPAAAPTQREAGRTRVLPGLTLGSWDQALDQTWSRTKSHRERQGRIQPPSRASCGLTLLPVTCGTRRLRGSKSFCHIHQLPSGSVCSPCWFTCSTPASSNETVRVLLLKCAA